MAFDSIPLRVQEQARRRADAPAYCVRSEGRWASTSWRRYVDEIRRAGKALIALGMEPGVSAGIIGFNRPEWTIFHLAAMSVRGVPVGVYTTSAPSEVQYIVEHAEAPIVLVEDAAQWRKLESQRDHLPRLRSVVMMRGAARVADPMVVGWDEFLAAGDAVADAAFDQRLTAIEPHDLGTLIYTSGTTGPPKGVMLTHANLAWTAGVAGQIADVRADDVLLSYLPLSHIAEQMFTIHAAATIGYSVHFAESIEAMLDNLKEVQPHAFFGVPRVWEKFHAGIAAKLRTATGVKRRLADWAMRVGRSANAAKCGGQQPTGLLALQYRLADRLVFSKLKPAIGLGRARICLSGAAPIAPDVLEFLAGLDILVHEVYGQSEDSGPTSFNLPGRTRIGSVGHPIPGLDVRVADDGEILVRGPNVFAGYYKDPAATAETLVDDWLHSGDLGRIDADGFLHITGRKKEIIITAGGKNITPKNIEAALKQLPLINEATVIGDRRKYLVALLTLDPDAAAAFAAEHGISPSDVHTHPALHDAIAKHVAVVNDQLARVEQVKKFRVLARNFTLEDGELTPTLKVKRKVVQEHFAGEIEALYGEDDEEKESGDTIRLTAGGAGH